MIDYDQIDVGVRDVVRALNAAGYRTTDSGDGSKARWMEGAFAYPMVVVAVDDPFTLIEAADNVWNLLRHADDRTWAVEASYSPNDGVCCILATAPEDVDGYSQSLVQDNKRLRTENERLVDVVEAYRGQMESTTGPMGLLRAAAEKAHAALYDIAYGEPEEHGPTDATIAEAAISALESAGVKS